MDAAVNATLLGIALAWRWGVGRVLRGWGEGVAGRRGSIEHPALDLVIGLLAGWLGFAVWSAVITRGIGTEVPLHRFAVAELLFVGALGVREVALRDEGWRPSLPHRQTLIRLATIVVLFAALAPRAIFTFMSETTDQDQHVAWAVEIAQQGVVPSHYEGTDAAIDYPLGFHALAASASASIVSPAIVVNVLPLLTSILVVTVICAAVLAVAIGGPPANGSAPLPGADLLLLEAGCSVALALALFSGHFSVLTRYVILPRNIAGLCHLVPVLVWASALSRPAPSPPDRAALRASALQVTAMVVSGALIAALNPTLVPLHAALCGVALLTAAARRRIDGMGSAAGFAAGAALSLAVIAADPYLARRAGLPGLRPPPAPYLQNLQADFSRHFTGRTCLTAACLARAATSLQARAHAAEPWAALTIGALELVHRPPAPLRWDLPAPGRHRFPDLTGVGLAPVHGGAAPYMFAALTPLFVAVVLWTRHRALGWAAVTLGGAIAIDAALRGVLHALVDPGDPTLRLLPNYADVASAVVFTQLLWPLLLVGAACAGWSADTPRRRGLRLAVVFAILVPLGVSAAGPVAAGMIWGRPFDVPSRADLAALDRLERRFVPVGETFLVASRAPAESGERWIFPTDDAVFFYLHARRPTLFLYFLDHTARYGSAGLEATCAALQIGPGNTLLERHRARWAVWAGPTERAVEAVGQRMFCSRRLREWFPDMRPAGTDGRLTIVELWGGSAITSQR
jgi:hypothetical protein